jgi:hypothetical protein
MPLQDWNLVKAGESKAEVRYKGFPHLEVPVKLFYLATAIALLVSFTVRADESIVYGCRIVTTNDTYRGLGLSTEEALDLADELCQKDKRNSESQCSEAKRIAVCYDLTD